MYSRSAFTSASVLAMRAARRSRSRGFPVAWRQMVETATPVLAAYSSSSAKMS